MFVWCYMLQHATTSLQHATTCYGTKNALVFWSSNSFRTELSSWACCPWASWAWRQTADWTWDCHSHLLKKIVPATFSNMQYQYQYVSNSIIRQFSQILLTLQHLVTWFGYLQALQDLWTDIFTEGFDFLDSTSSVESTFASSACSTGSCWRIMASKSESQDQRRLFSFDWPNPWYVTPKGDSQWLLCSQASIRPWPGESASRPGWNQGSECP